MRKRLKRTRDLENFLISEDERKRLLEVVEERRKEKDDRSDLIPIEEDEKKGIVDGGGGYRAAGDEGADEEKEPGEGGGDEADDDRVSIAEHGSGQKPPAGTTACWPTSSRSKKPVPMGYVCASCKGQRGSHWIYDCPLRLEAKKADATAGATVSDDDAAATTLTGGGKKKGKRGTAGMVDPSDRKVFVSGMPFTASARDAASRFEAYGPVVSVKMLKVPSTGRKSGQAIVNYEDVEGAKACLAGEEGKKWDGRSVSVGRVKRREGKKRMGGTGKERIAAKKRKTAKN